MADPGLGLGCHKNADLNTTNVKNMYLHRDSNPGPWNM